MTDIKNIEELSKFDNEIRKMALQITKNKDEADDLTQDFYIAYIKKQPENINKFYVWVSLQNINITNIRKNKVRREYINNHNNNEIDEEYNEENDLNIENNLQLLNQIISEQNFFERELFKLNKIKKMSVKKISDETQIPIKSIRFAINKVQTKLNQKLNGKNTN